MFDEPLSDPTIIDPASTALVTMEVQRGVLGDLATIPLLAQIAERDGVVGNITDLVMTARRVGVRVVHCLAAVRTDRWGAPDHTPLMARLADSPNAVVAGMPAAEIIPELGPEPSDAISARCHGLTPFPGTDLDILLRSAGVTTVVAVGASLNVGVLGLVLGAVDASYRVVVPADAVVGIPHDYGQAVLRHTIGHVGHVTTTRRILDEWQP